MNKTVHIFTDGLGDSGQRLYQAVMKQFPGKTYRMKIHRFIRSKEGVDKAFLGMEEGDIIFSTLLGIDVRKYCLELAQDKYPLIDFTGFATDILEKSFQEKAVDALNPFVREKDEHYFDRMKAIEFAVRYDDGKDPHGILQADVVLMGVSRTSKTPTSMLLANYNLKVANLPLIPEISLPKEIYMKEKERIFGLIIHPSSLNEIRMSRLREMGLDTENSNYADAERIERELDYARKVMQEIGCKVIDVSDKNIEETAVIIMDSLASLA